MILSDQIRNIETSILPLKLAAVRAGLGWQGKHSVVITKEYGSWVTFGGIITDAPLDYDTTSTYNGCGKCTKCLDACPVGAIKEPYIVDMSLWEIQVVLQLLNIFQTTGNILILWWLKQQSGQFNR